MQPVRERIGQVVGAAFEAIGLPAEYGAVTISGRPELGDYQCNGALAAAKKAGRNPREIAQDVAEQLGSAPEFSELSIAGPGFLNLRIADALFAEAAAAMQSESRLGVERAGDAGRVVIDFGGPNVAKAMHVGHLRSSIIGDSLQRLLLFTGDEVTSDIHLGDWGLPMGILIEELRREQPELPYFEEEHEGDYPAEPPVSIADLERLYPQGSLRTKEDPAALAAAGEATAKLQTGHPGYRALWRHFISLSRQALDRDFGRLGVHFDLWQGESTVSDRVEPMIERLQQRGVVAESQGARVIEVEQDQDKVELPPLMLIKSDGGWTYATTDLATLEQRAEELAPDRVLYVVDQRQALHFKQVFRAAKKGGLIDEETSLEHIAFGTVNGPDGKPFKTRAGGVMKLADLIEMAVEMATRRLEEGEIGQEYGEQERAEIARLVGLAALRFADLSNQRSSDYVFDLDRFTRFEGKTGPYLLYAAVRIKSIFARGEVDRERSFPVEGPFDEHERALLMRLLTLSDAIERARSSRMPHHLCEQAWELAQEFSRFYNHCPVLKAESEPLRERRLGLSSLTLLQLETLLNLLGIEVPERM